ncbi:MAG: AmmeMemoRadiSam system radical SAM enzyme [Rhodospirillaceae bacterium]|nr:AmmeMemoRadiSam system radical SAM enzyme [Rhodospirillaceae bacterium]
MARVSKPDAPLTADSFGVVPGRFWHQLDDGRFQCDVCPRFCKLRPGQRGLCFVRQGVEDGIVLTAYGRSSGYCIDPIEKKPLNHFLPGSPVLSFGTAGCNLACKFCQNWDISKSREMERLADHAPPEKIARVAKRLGCKSVAFTYNDPVIFHEYAVDVAQACREVGVKTVAVTAGYHAPEARAEFYNHMDGANVDLKAFTERFYKQVCAGSLADVLDTLKYLKHETDVWFEITTLLIPDENDSESEIEEMTQWVFENLSPDVPVHFSAFHPDYRMNDKQRTPSDTLFRSRQIALKNGLHYVYTDNVHDEDGGSTYCHNCRAPLIGRDWHELKSWGLTSDGRCATCRTPCPGVFDGPPGRWGRKRKSVKLREFA